MRIKSYTLVGGGAADAVAFAAGQTTTANTALTLTAAAIGAALLATPRELTITSAADFSAVTFTAVGRDRWGNTITEVITGPNATTVTGRKVFAFITSITPSATVGSNVSVGYPQRVTSPWVLCDTIGATDSVPQVGVATQIIAGAPDGAIETTYENFMQVSGDGAVVDDSTDVAPPDNNVVQGGGGVRFVLTTATGTIKVRFVRPRF